MSTGGGTNLYSTSSSLIAVATDVEEGAFEHAERMKALARYCRLAAEEIERLAKVLAALEAENVQLRAQAQRTAGD